MVKAMRMHPWLKPDDGSTQGRVKDVELTDEELDSIITNDEQPAAGGTDEKGKKTEPGSTGSTKAGDENASEKTGNKEKETSSSDATDAAKKGGEGSETGTGEDEQAEPGGKDEGSDEAFVTIDDKPYSFEDVKKALEDVPAMQQASTQKYQEAADLRKAIQPVVDFMAMAKDKKAVDEIRETIEDVLGEEGAAAFDKAAAFDAAKYENPFKAELAAAESERDDYKAMLGLRDEMDELMERRKLSRKAVNEVFDFALAKHKEGKTLSLDEAFIMMDYPNQVARSKSTGPGKAPVKKPEKTHGATVKKSEESDQKPISAVTITDDEFEAITSE